MRTSRKSIGRLIAERLDIKLQTTKARQQYESSKQTDKLVAAILAAGKGCSNA